MTGEHRAEGAQHPESVADYIVRSAAVLPTKPRKALMAFLALLGTGIGTAMLNGALTQPEAIAAAGGALVGAFAVWRIPNPIDGRKLNGSPWGKGADVYTGGPRG